MKLFDPDDLLPTGKLIIVFSAGAFSMYLGEAWVIAMLTMLLIGGFGYGIGRNHRPNKS